MRLPFSSNPAASSEISCSSWKERGGRTHAARIVGVDDDVEQAEPDQVNRGFYGDLPLLRDALEALLARDLLRDLLETSGRVEGSDFLQYAVTMSMTAWRNIIKGQTCSWTVLRRIWRR